MKHIIPALFSSILLTACTESGNQPNTKDAVVATTVDTLRITPAVTTEKVLDDSDDPAIWINSADLSKSLILGTDKNKDSGGVYAFSLDGKIIREKTVTGLKRINNIDIAYGLTGPSGKTDIAAATERLKNSIRIFSLPDMKLIDNGGIPVFEGEAARDPMGIALYTRPSDKAIFAIVGRKTGPQEGYLFQYLLSLDKSGTAGAKLVRKFGKFSGKKEIESIAVDNELGYVYYSDEQTGVRKYYADPEKGNEELAVFGSGEFKDDNEGISIYKFPDGTGYILVSDQAANTFNVYPREGIKGNPNEHQRLAIIPVSTSESDGSDITSISLPGFDDGLFVAMSTGGTFQYYRWADMAQKAGLKVWRMK